MFFAVLADDQHLFQMRTVCFFEPGNDAVVNNCDLRAGVVQVVVIVGGWKNGIDHRDDRADF